MIRRNAWLAPVQAVRILAVLAAVTAGLGELGRLQRCRLHGWLRGLRG